MRDFERASALLSAAEHASGPAKSSLQLSGHHYLERASHSACTRCALSQGRSQVILPSFANSSRLAVIGHHPTLADERTGRPFSFEQGKVLDWVLGAIGLTRLDALLANVVSCAPRNNDAAAVESASAVDHCVSWLWALLDLHRPLLSLLVGPEALSALVGDKPKFATALRKPFWHRDHLFMAIHPLDIHGEFDPFTQIRHAALWLDDELPIPDPRSAPVWLFELIRGRQFNQKETTELIKGWQQRRWIAIDVDSIGRVMFHATRKSKKRVHPPDVGQVHTFDMNRAVRFGRMWSPDHREDLRHMLGAAEVFGGVVL